MIHHALIAMLMPHIFTPFALPHHCQVVMMSESHTNLKELLGGLAAEEGSLFRHADAQCTGRTIAQRSVGPTLRYNGTSPFCQKLWQLAHSHKTHKTTRGGRLLRHVCHCYVLATSACIVSDHAHTKTHPNEFTELLDRSGPCCHSIFHSCTFIASMRDLIACIAVQSDFNAAARTSGCQKAWSLTMDHERQ